MRSILTADPDSPVAVEILTCYMCDVVTRYHGRPATDGELAAALLDEPAVGLTGEDGSFVIALDDDVAIGCGGVRLNGRNAELTKLFVKESWRGKGVASQILDFLEGVAAERGFSAIRLDTRSDLTEACSLYESRGYGRIPAFNDDPHSDRWYSKPLRPSAK